MKTVDTGTRFDQLERTVLEMATEVYTLKGTIARNHESHDQFLSIIKGLKQLLDEKGLITLDDFDAAIELGEALERFNAQKSQTVADEVDLLKKTGH